MNKNGITIREASEKDIEDIMKIEAEAFHSSIRETQETFSERIRIFHEGCLVLTDTDDKPIGYITSEIWKYREEVQKSNFTLGHSIRDVHDPEGEELYISSMGVLRTGRGNSYGGLLINTLIEKLLETYPKMRSSILVVSEKWENAHRIYMRNGFTDISYIEDFFTHDNCQTGKGIIMRKRIR